MSNSFSGQPNNAGLRKSKEQPDNKDYPAGRLNPTGLMEDKDVASKRTALVIDTTERARLDIKNSRKILFMACMLTGLLIMTGPWLASNLAEYFFYNDSQILWALRRVASELWIVFALPGLLLVLCSIMGFAKKIPVAAFNLANQTIRLKQQRFHTLIGWNGRFSGEVIQLQDVAGLQIVSYKAKQLQYRDQPADQFELNLLLDNGERRLLAKQPGYESLFLDATRLAEFLMIDMKDHSNGASKLPA